MKRSTPENDMYARSASPDLREIKQNLNLATDSRYDMANVQAAMLWLTGSDRHRQCKTADYQSTTTQKKSLAEANKKVNIHIIVCRIVA